MITFLESVGTIKYLPKITISTMTEKGEHIETCELNRDNIYKITAFDPKTKKLISYTGKINSYTVSENSSKKTIPIILDSIMSVKSLVIDCSIENESRLITIDICNIRNIKVFSNNDIEVIEYGIKEFK